MTALAFALVVLGVALAGTDAPPTPATQAAPISAHAMVHACCTPAAMKESIFAEAEAVGAGYIRVDVEMSAIFEGPGGVERNSPDWSGLDEVMELSRKHDLPVLGVLLAPPAYISTCPERWPDSGRCAAADPEEFGRLAEEIAKHSGDAIRHWEVVNEPDGEWAFEGTAEEYARMLSAAYDGIKSGVPGDRIVLGGVMRPHDPAWLGRVFATPGADAVHKFDIANVHLRGAVGAVVDRYLEFRAWLGTQGFTGPLWVTEHGYPADPAYQMDPAFTGGNGAQAGYLTQSIVGLGEAGAEQVFVTLRDNLAGEYATEGLVHIDEAPAPIATRRESFAAVQRLAEGWDQVMTWRREQRENEHLVRVHQAAASVYASEARTARGKFHSAVALVHEAQDALAMRPRSRSPSRSRRVAQLLERRLTRAHAVVAERRAILLWNSGFAREQRTRAYLRALAVEALKRQIAGGS